MDSSRRFRSRGGSRADRKDARAASTPSLAPEVVALLLAQFSTADLATVPAIGVPRVVCLVTDGDRLSVVRSFRSWMETMKLPQFEQAIIPQRKLTEYLLSFSHRDGRSKAVFFAGFGFTVEAWVILADALRRHAAEHDVVATEQTPFGASYTVEGTLLAPDGRTPLVRVVWFIETGENVPRLVTAYPLKEAK